MSLWTMTDEAAGKPKYQSDTLRNTQEATDKAVTFGVDATEESVTANKAKGVQHPGWVTVRTYVDAQGRTRYKSETLVAAGSMVSDATDDATVADLAIVIDTQPQSGFIVSPADATLTVVASVNSNEALTFQWYDASDDSAIEGATTDTLELTGITAPQAYYVIVSCGGASVQSETAQLQED